MKKLFMSVLVMVGFGLSAMAFAEEYDWEVDGQKGRIFKFESQTLSSEHVLTKEEIGKGVFVSAVEDNDELPNATLIIKKRFAEKGIVVVDKIADADVSIAFSAEGAFSMRAPNQSMVMDDSSISWHDEQVRLYGDIRLKPIEGHLWGMRTLKSGVKDGTFVTHDRLFYHRDNPGTKAETLLKLLVDAWIFKHIAATEHK